MQKQLKELHPGHRGPFALWEGPSHSPELEVDRTDKALALSSFTQRLAAVWRTKNLRGTVKTSADSCTLQHKTHLRFFLKIGCKYRIYFTSSKQYLIFCRMVGDARTYLNFLKQKSYLSSVQTWYVSMWSKTLSCWLWVHVGGDFPSRLVSFVVSVWPRRKKHSRIL